MPGGCGGPEPRGCCRFLPSCFRGHPGRGRSPDQPDRRGHAGQRHGHCKRPGCLCIPARCAAADGLQCRHSGSGPAGAGRFAGQRLDREAQL
nr:MAG TPA: hypothetical protein [Caudoviricetes sp.]